MHNLNWLLVKTAIGKELAVSRAIQTMGHPVWCPTEVRFNTHKRKTKTRRLWEVPVLPQMLFAAIPEAAHGDLQRIRYYEALGRDADRQAITIPANQIQLFRDSLDYHNAIVRRAYHRAITPKTAKGKRYKLEPELRDLLMSVLFGDVQSPAEEAA